MQIGASSTLSMIWHEPVSIHEIVRPDEAGGSIPCDITRNCRAAGRIGARAYYIPPMNTLSLSRESDPVEHHDMQTVLVVEDEMMVRMPIAEYLRDCGYTVLEAADASEAIATINAEGPVSLVFSDIRMPGKMDGFGLAEWFQSHYPRCRSC